MVATGVGRESYPQGCRNTWSVAATKSIAGGMFALALFLRRMANGLKRPLESGGRSPWQPL